MRTTRAFIAGLGATGSLVAATACAFLAASAMVTFNGWPGGGMAGDVSSLFVGKEPIPVVSPRSEGGVAKGVVGDSTAAAGPVVSTRSDPLSDPAAVDPAGASGRPEGSPAAPAGGGATPPGAGGSDGGGDLGGGSSGPEVGNRPGATHPAPAAPDLGTAVANPTDLLGDTVSGTTGQLGDTVSGTTGQLGDTVSGTTGQVGGAVGGPVGDLVTHTGQAADELITNTGRPADDLVTSTGQAVDDVVTGLGHVPGVIRTK